MSCDAEHTNDEQFKDIFAVFGRAVSHAQCFEMSVGNLLLGNRKVTDPTFTLNEFNALATNLKKKTLGALLTECRRFLPADAADSEDILSKALDRRNFLIHHFFKERWMYFYSEDGRNKLRDELMDITNDLNKADVVIVILSKIICTALGATDEMWEKLWANQQKQIDLLNM